MTASERAAEVIYAMLDDEHAVVACLMADPALLVDLAIEAGGLEPDGAYWLPDEWESEGDGRSGVYYDDDAPEVAEPLYRATPLHATKAEVVARHGTAYPSYAHIDEATSPRTTQENGQP